MTVERHLIERQAFNGSEGSLRDVSDELPLKVLLIEDSSDDVVLMEQLIERSQLTVELKVVNNGEAALEYLCRGVDVAEQVVLLDLSLPGVSGIEVLRRLKDDEQLTDIPVIILSGTENDAEIKHGQDLKAHTHIVKPMSLYEFTWIVNSVKGYWRRIEKLKATFVNPPPIGLASRGMKLKDHRTGQ